jgi:CP family cyanate transporter-like MFS transporter
LKHGSDEVMVDATAGEQASRPIGSDRAQPVSRLLVILALFLIGVNLRPAISSVAPLLEAIRNGIGLSSSGAGLLTTLPVLCFGVFAPLAPRMVRWLSEDRAIMVGLLALAAGIGTRIFFGTFGMFAGTLVAGISIGVIMVLLPGIVKRDFPHHAGLMMGGYSMALNVGAALGAGITVPIQKMAGGDWRIALVFWIFPVFAAAAAWWPLLRSRANQAASPQVIVRGMLRNKLAWHITGFMGLQSALAYCVFGWLPTILIDRGMTPLAAGFMLSLSIMMQLVTSMAVPWLAGRARSQRPAIMAMMIVYIAGLLGCLYVPLDSVWVSAVLLGLGQGGSFGIALTLIVLRARDVQVGVALSGMVQGFGYLIAAAGPLVVGILRDLTTGCNMVAAFFVAVGIAAIYTGMGAGRNQYVEAEVSRVR